MPTFPSANTSRRCFEFLGPQHSAEAFVEPFHSAHWIIGEHVYRVFVGGRLFHGLLRFLGGPLLGDQPDDQTQHDEWERQPDQAERIDVAVPGAEVEVHSCNTNDGVSIARASTAAWLVQHVCGNSEPVSAT